MCQQLRPARVFPPGRVLSEELEARGWTQKDLADIVNRPVQTINEIVRGTKQITPDTALELAAAFGTSAEFWTNLEANYRLHLARQKKDEQVIIRKSRLYNLVPIAELVKHGWIRAASTLEELEQEACNFLQISSLDDYHQITVNFRCSLIQQPEANARLAWVKRVEHLVAAQPVAEFDRGKLSKAIPDLLKLAVNAKDIVQVPSLLMNLGIHFAIVPHLSKTYLDGAAFYINDNPVVALSLRHDRIDAFWFTLMHELAHIYAGHEGVLDNLDEGDINEDEREANSKARNWLIEEEALHTFVQATKPYFSEEKIKLFAESQRRHPGIVLGRLQHDETVGYQHLRSLLVKVKPFLKEWIDVSVSTR